MDKIVGKNFNMKRYQKKVLFFLMFLCLPLIGQISMQVFDADGNKLDVAGAGQPFTIEVTIEGVSNSNIRPEIQGLEKVYVRANGLFMTTINGRSTLKYKYKARIDSPGTYTIGPASIDDNGSTINSNIISLAVRDQPVAQRVDKSQSNVGGAFLRLTADKDRAVVGETIKCFLRFYYGNDVTNLSPINLQQIPGFIIGENNQTTRGTEAINGKQYNYIEIQWNMCASETGKKIIPAFAADFAVRTRAHDLMGHLSMFLGHGGEPKRVYSNALNIQVDGLPSHNGPVHAIGTFAQFNARLEPGVAKEGEGMVLTLELEGQGNFNKNILDLNLPNSFKFYDSKNYPMDASQSGMQKQCFEFIVQGLQKGDFEIPSQKFCFFDTKNRKYKTLETLPIAVTILASQGGQQKFNLPDTKSQLPESSSQAIEVTDEIHPLNHTGAFYRTSERSMPWLLFFMLTLLPIIFLLYQWAHRSVRLNQSSGRKQKGAFKNARQQLDAAVKTQNSKALYGIFIQLFASRYQIPESQVSQEFIYEKLVQKKLSGPELDQWQQFFNQLSEYVFFARAAKAGEIFALGQYASGWIDRFEQIL